MSEPKFDLDFFAAERARKAREFQTRHVSGFASPPQLALLLIGITLIGGAAYAELPQRAFSALRDQTAAISTILKSWNDPESPAPMITSDFSERNEREKTAPVPVQKKVALAASLPPVTTSPASVSASAPSTIVNNFPIERTIERILVADPALLAGYVTQAHLNSQLESIRSNIGVQLYGPTYPQPATTPTNAGITGTVAMMGRIEHLEEVELVSPTITNARISGISGLTDADIPDSLTLTSLTVSGPLSLPYFSATSTDTASTFPYASTTALSANTLCLSADCRDSWPAGGGSGGLGHAWELFGAGTYLAPTTTKGIIVNASSTVGNGTQAGGLTISGGATTTGDLILSGSGRRIRSDFSSGGSSASHTQFQTTVANGGTFIGALPAGTSRYSGFTAYGGSDPDNASVAYYGINDLSNNEASIGLFGTGSGTAPDFTIYDGNFARLMVLKQGGNFGIGTTTPYTKLSVVGDIVAARFVATTSVASIFPYASSTAISATTVCLTSDCRSSWPTGGTSFGQAFEVAGNGYLAPTTTRGIIINASSTIGNGTQAGGLTISGGATTTGNVLIQGSATTTSLGITGVTSSLLKTLASGAVVAATAGTDYLAAMLFGESFNITSNTFGETALAPTTTLNLAVNGTGTSTFAGGLEAWRQIAAPYFHATSASATSTFAGGLTAGNTAGFRVTSAGRVGINTATPDTLLTIASTTGAFTAPREGTLIHAIGEGPNGVRVALDGYSTSVGVSAGVNLRRSRGTSPSPSAALSGDTLGYIAGDGYGATGFHAAAPAFMAFMAEEGQFTDTSAAIGIRFVTSATGTVSGTERMRIASSGNVGIGTSSPYAKLTLWGNSSGTLLEAATSASTTVFRISSEGFGTTTVSGLSVSGSATSTSNVGFNLSAGCFAVNNVCIGASTGGTLFGQSWEISGGVLSPTSSLGILVSASSTLGNGTQDGGLTVSGGATTTGNSYVAGTLRLASALAETSGGTGQNAYTAGDILYASASNILSRLAVGAPGQVLKVSGGLPSWGADNTSGGGGGASAWSTTTDSLAIYPSDTSDVLIIGNSATATTNSILEVVGRSYFSNTLGIATTSPGSIFSIGGVGNFAPTGSTLYSQLTLGSITGTSSALFASTTLSGSSLFTNATTTSFAISNIASGNLLKTTTGGALVAAVAGTDYLTGSTIGSFADWSVIGGTDYIRPTTTLGIIVNASSTFNSLLQVAGNAYFGGNVGIGTSTPSYALNPFSSTASQLALSAGGGLAQWAFRNAGGNLYLATTTEAGTATTSTSALTIVGSTGRIGFNNTLPVSTFQISQGDGLNDTRLTIDNAAGNRAIATFSNASKHVSIGMGAPGVSILGDRFGAGLSGSAVYSFSIEHTGTYDANLGVKVNATTALHPLTVGETETPAYSTAVLGVYGAGESFATFRDTTNNVELLTGVNAGGGVIGSLTTGSPLILFAGGSEHMRLTSSGNLGIGTSSPYARLSVAGDVVGARFIATTSVASIFPYASSTALSASVICLSADCRSSWPSGGAGGSNWNVVGGNLYLTPSSTIGYIVSASSTIGNGTQAGGLTISGGATTTGEIIIQGTGTSTLAGGLTIEGTGFIYDRQTNRVGISTAAPTKLLSLGTGTGKKLALYDGAGDFYGLGIGSSGSMDFYVQDTGSVDPLLTLVSGQRVGIGTTSPWAKFSVTNTGSSPSFIIEDSTSPDATPFIIDASGNVGIGTTSPWKTLSVAGTISLTGQLFDRYASAGTAGYALIATSSGVAWEGFTASSSGAITRSWQSKSQDTVSVIDYGADPTGVSDSTSAIQTAVDSGAKTVNFPHGNYRINTTVTITRPVTLQGPGRDSTFTATAPVNILTSGTSNDIFRINADNVTIDGLYLSGTGARAGNLSQGRGIVIGSDYVSLADGAINASDATFTSASASFTSSDVGKYIRVVGAGTGGAALTSTISAVTSGTEIELSSNASATVSGAATTYSKIYEGTVIRNVGIASHAIGIHILNAQEYTVRDSSINGVDAIWIENLVNADGGDGVLDNLHLTSSSTVGRNVYTTSGGGLRIMNTKFLTARDDLVMNYNRDTSGGPILVGNSFENTSRYFIYAAASTTSQINGITATGNWFNGSSGSGVITFDNGSDTGVIKLVKFTGNTITSASADRLFDIGKSVDGFEISSNYLTCNDYAGAIGIDVRSSAANGSVFGNRISDCITPVRNSGTSVAIQTVSESGSFGFGTTSPAARAHVYSGAASVAANSAKDDLVIESDTAAGISVLVPNGQSAGIAFGSPSNALNWHIQSTDASTFDIYRLGAAALSINSNSYLGVGTTSPGSLLSVGNTNGINFSTGTSTFSSTGGINLTGGGCFAINGVCVAGSGGSGTVTSIAAGTGLTGGTINVSGTIALDLSNANTWTGLQLFSGKASSTQFSVLDGLFVGRTSTTTIRGDGLASTLPYASSTAISATTICLSADCRTSWPSGGAGGSNWNVVGGTLYLTPSSTIGYIVNASSTIGNGTQAGGLTVSGGATTTGNAYFAGNIGIRTQPSATNALDVAGFINTDQYSGFKQAGNTVLYASTTNDSVAVGASAAASWMSATSSVFDAVAVGDGALSTAPSSGIARYNTAVGVRTLRDNTTGSMNAAFGGDALRVNTTGFQNTALGYGALTGNTTARYNTAVGTYALTGNSTGENNTAVGLFSIIAATSSSNHVAIGGNALENMLSYFGNDTEGNTVVGNGAGRQITYAGANTLMGYLVGNNITTGSHNLVIGYDIDAPSATADNQLNIGNILFGLNVNSTGTTVDSDATIGIGTSTPYSRLSLWGAGPLLEAVSNSSTTIFKIGQDGATTTSFAISNIMNSLLAANANGSVVATTSLSASLIEDRFLRNDGDDTTAGSLTATHFVGSNASATSTLSGGLTIETSGFVYDFTSNNVGIGTASPSGRLHVNGTIVGNGNVNIGDNQRGFFIDDVGSFTYGIGKSAAGTSARFDLYANGQKASLTSTGNFGVGTTSPYSKLTAWGTGQLFEAVNNSSTTLMRITQSGVVLPSITSSLLKTDASGLVSAASAGTDYASPVWFDVTDYGATGDGVTDDTTAIQNALAAVPAIGGTVYFPEGTYLVSSPLVLTNKLSRKLVGVGTNRSSNDTQTSNIVYTAASGNLITAHGARGLGISNLNLSYSNAAYSGTLVDLAKTEEGATYTSAVSLYSCRVAGLTGSSGNALLINLDQTLHVNIEKCYFARGSVAIQGATSTYIESNNITIKDNWFNYPFSSGYAIKAGGTKWTIANNVFEPATAGLVAGALETTTTGIYGLDFQGNWLGDAVSGTWINVTGGKIEGGQIIGNTIHGSGSTIAMNLSSSTGLSISGNEFRVHTALIVDNATNLSLSANTFPGVTTRVSGSYTASGVFDTNTASASSTIMLGGERIVFLPRQNSFASNSIFFGNGGTSTNHVTGNDGYYNTGVGFDSLLYNTTGYYNSALGTGALQANTIGRYNAAFGSAALYSNIDGESNTAVGHNALRDNTTGSSNAAVGYGALTSNTSGATSTAFGYTALGQNLTGSRNVGIGPYALYNTTSTSNQVALGYQALYGNSADSSGTSNTAIGYQALLSNSSGSNNTALGYAALQLNTTGSQNSAAGLQALQNNTTGTGNSAFGYLSLWQNTDGDYNTGIGRYALLSNTTGDYNTGLGAFSGQYTTTGSQNVSVGYTALSSNRTGISNVALGYAALANNMSATTTTAVGAFAGYGNGGQYNNRGGTYLGYLAGYAAATSSDFNTFLGYQSGANVTTGSNNLLIGSASSSQAIANLTTGSQNILIGNNISLPSATADGQLNIGNIIFGTNITGTGSIVSSGNIGIGTTSPYAKLSVTGEIVAARFTATSSVASQFPFASSTAISATTICLTADCRSSWPSGGASGSNWNVVGGTLYLTPSSTIGYIVSASSTIGNGTQAGGLTVSGGATTTGNLRVQGTGTSTFTGGIQGATGYISGLLQAANGLFSTLTSAISSLGYASTTQLSSAGNTYLATGGGNVGIGTSTPNRALSVIGASLFGSTPTGAGVLIQTNGSYGEITGINHANNAFNGLYFTTGGTPAITINTSGKVGIGTTTPTYTLDVDGDTRITDGYLTFQNSNLLHASGSMHRWENVYASSTYQYLDSAGLALYQNTAAAGDFSSKRLIFQVHSNPGRGANEDTFFPVPPGSSIGEDGGTYLATNAFDIVSTNGLRAIQVNTTPTISSGQITAVSVDSSISTYTFTPTVVAYDFNGTGSGAQFTANMTGGTVTSITVNSPGSNYSADTIVYVQPSLTAPLDLGPQINISRDVANTATSSYLGFIYFQGRSTGSSVVDTVYASIGSQVDDPSTAYKLGKLVFSTGGPSTLNAGNNPRFYIGRGLFSAYVTGGDKGIDTVNVKGYYLDGNRIVHASSTTGVLGVGINAVTGDYATSTTLGTLGVGFEALKNATSSLYNTAVGYQALKNVSDYSNGSGVFVSLNNRTGSNNTAIGYQALTSNTSGTFNTAVGFQALANVSTSSYNTAVGYRSLYLLGTGRYNTAVGEDSLFSNVNGEHNTVVGQAALLLNTSGIHNAVLGQNALYNDRTGSYNTVVGSQALFSNISATNTVAVGYLTGGGAGSPYSNQGGTYVGFAAGASLSNNSDYNTLLGYLAGYDITSGANNTIIGQYFTANTSITTGSGNILIGNAVRAGLSQTGDNQLNIGNLIFGSGLSSATTVSTGKIGVGTSTPWRTLSVTGTVGFDGLTGSTGAGSICLDSNKQIVYNSASDACLSSTRATKNTIDPLTLDALNQVMALAPVSFIYNEGDGRVRYGFIAEDTAAVDDHLATHDAAGTISGIDDRAILAVVVKAIQELSADIVALTETIAGFAQRLVTEELVAVNGSFETISTNQLCVGSVCVTEAQFMSIFGNGVMQTGSVMGSQESPPAESGTPEDSTPTETPAETAPETVAAPAETTPETPVPESLPLIESTPPTEPDQTEASLPSPDTPIPSEAE